MITKDFVTDTKIVGVTAENDKGAPIQILLPMLSPGDQLIFVRDYGNTYDANAIKVLGKSGQHIGYLNKELSSKLSLFFETNPGMNIEGIVNEVTGGTDGKLYGCNIRIWIQAPGMPTYEGVKNFQGENKEQNSAQSFNGSQSYIPFDSNDKNKSKKNYTPVFIVIALVLIFVIFYFPFQDIVNFFSNGDSSGNTTTISSNNNVKTVDSKLITLNEYHKLKTGMSRSEVYDIIGSYGEMVSESSADGYRITMYSYEGYGSAGANAQLMFENGKLTTMSQYGLDYDLGENSSSTDNDSSNLPHTTENPPIDATDVYFDITILPPDTIGTIWMEATYKNNSKYPITYLQATVLLKDTNEKVYLSSADTVLPGETSPVFDTFGPKSLKTDDIEFLECIFKIIGDNNTEMFVEWDLKLGTYEIY